MTYNIYYKVESQYKMINALIKALKGIIITGDHFHKRFFKILNVA